MALQFIGMRNGWARLDENGFVNIVDISKFSRIGLYGGTRPKEVGFFGSSHRPRLYFESDKRHRGK